jgi:hypothetical protein
MNFFSWNSLQRNDPDPGLFVDSHHLDGEWRIGFSEIIGQNDNTRLFPYCLLRAENGMTEASRLILIDTRCADASQELIEAVKQLTFPLGGKPSVELAIKRKIAAQVFFIATNNKNDLFNPRSDGFLNHILCGGPIYNQEKFFGYCLRDW